MRNLCCNCVNFLDLDKDKTGCDYEYFWDVHISKSGIFIPDLFECDKWELDPNQKEGV